MKNKKTAKIRDYDKIEELTQTHAELVRTEIQLEASM